MTCYNCKSKSSAQSKHAESRLFRARASTHIPSATNRCLRAATSAEVVLSGMSRQHRRKTSEIKSIFSYQEFHKSNK